MGWDRGCDGGDLGGRFGFSGWGWGLMGMGGRCPLEAEAPQQLPRGLCGTPQDPGWGGSGVRTSRARAAARAARGSSWHLPAPTCACPAMAAAGPRGSRGPGGVSATPAASPARASGAGPAHSGSAAMAQPEAAPRKRRRDPGTWGGAGAGVRSQREPELEREREWECGPALPGRDYLRVPPLRPFLPVLSPFPVSAGRALPGSSPLQSRLASRVTNCPEIQILRENPQVYHQRSLRSGPDSGVSHGLSRGLHSCSPLPAHPSWICLLQISLFSWINFPVILYLPCAACP